MYGGSDLWTMFPCTLRLKKHVLLVSTVALIKCACSLSPSDKMMTSVYLLYILRYFLYILVYPYNPQDDDVVASRSPRTTKKKKTKHSKTKSKKNLEQ